MKKELFVKLSLILLFLLSGCDRDLDPTNKESVELNQAPTAIPQTITVEQNRSKVITLTGADQDGDTLRYSIVTDPVNGTLSGTVPNITYTPNVDYYGSDSFNFKVNDSTTDSQPATISITVTATTTALLPQNEPYYKYAWHLKSKDSFFNTSGYIIDQNADINITEVWNLTKGKGIRVAVIDDGVDIEHEDLKKSIYIAYNIDNNSTDVSNRSIDITKSLHGNTVSGFIVSPINGKGALGVAPEAELIAIKQVENSDAKTIMAFEYAKNQGAKVVNCSWGSENVSQAVKEELKSLYDANITILFASGNDSKDLDDPDINDESEVEWVIGVGASGENNDITNYSNYGSNIDVIAPGGDTLISIGVLGIDDTGTQGSTNQQSLVTNNYAFTYGSSFAAPVAAGVVALMYSVNPDITPKEVKTILIETADKVGGINAIYTNGFDQKRANGKINAGKAVLRAKNL